MDRGTIWTPEAFAPPAWTPESSTRNAQRSAETATANRIRKRAPPADIARHQAIEPKLGQRRHPDHRGGAKDEKEPPGGRHIELAQPQRHGQPQRQAQPEKVADCKDCALRVAPEAHQSQGDSARRCLERCPVLEPAHAFSHQRLAARTGRPLQPSSPRKRSRLCLPLFAIIARAIRAVNQGQVGETAGNCGADATPAVAPAYRLRPRGHACQVYSVK